MIKWKDMITIDLCMFRISVIMAEIGQPVQGDCVLLYICACDFALDVDQVPDVYFWFK